MSRLKARYLILKSFISRGVKFRAGHETKMDPTRAAPHIRKARLRHLPDLPDPARLAKRRRRRAAVRAAPPPTAIKKIQQVAEPPVITKRGKPTVAYLCMSFHPRLKINAIFAALDQRYPDELKVLYLMHQKPFPIPLKHDLPLRIVEVKVHGTWPALWFHKLAAFCRIVDQDIAMVWDEDDWFEPDYTAKAIKPIKAGAAFAWNYRMTLVKNIRTTDGWTPSILQGMYRSAIGTLVCRRDALVQIVERLRAKHPNGLTDTGGGPIDNRLRQMLEKENRPVPHEGVRRYSWHMNTNTKGDREARESIDYGYEPRRLPDPFRGKKPKGKRR